LADPLGWPTFDALLLQNVAAAFRHRRKAIRHQGALTCARVFDEKSRGTFERLNIDFKGLRRLDVRLSVWEDGSMWLRVCLPGVGRDSGWAFLSSFYGEIARLSVTEVVERFEATSLLCFNPQPDCAEKLRGLWREVGPRSA